MDDQQVTPDPNLQNVTHEVSTRPLSPTPGAVTSTGPSLPSTPVSAPAPAPATVPVTSATQPMVGEFAPSPGVITTPVSSPKKKKKRALFGIVVLVLAVLIGGSTAAYYTVIVPNKPENVLKTALKNTLDQTQVTAKATIEGKSSDSPAYKADLTIKSNRTTKASDVMAKITVTGFSVTVQARYIDGSAYVNVSDLSNITDLIGSFSPDYAEVATALNDKVTNQWFEIDSTLLKEANTDCFLSTDSSLTKADNSLLDKLYAKNPFVTIKSSAADVVSGKSATKYELSIDDNKTADFTSGLKDLSVVKKLNDCDKTTSQDQPTGDKDVTNSVKSSLKDNNSTPLTVWVDKKTKLITKLSSESTAKDKKDGVTGKVEITLDYAPVSVTKPDKSKPITSLLAELSSLFQDKPVLGAHIENLLPDSQQ